MTDEQSMSSSQYESISTGSPVSYDHESTTVKDCAIDKFTGDEFAVDQFRIFPSSLTRVPATLCNGDMIIDANNNVYMLVSVERCQDDFDDESMKVYRLRCSKEEILANAAEEAAELAQALSKLRRARTQISPTPITPEEALEQVYKELADVRLDLLAYGIDWNARDTREHLDRIVDETLKRTAARIYDRLKLEEELRNG